MLEQDDVFKALSDAHRRTLLDALFLKDGQTLTELCAHLPMSRYGVMKHLQILEDAGLVTTHKEGREKYHYLNAVPVQELYERWASKYAQPWAQTLTGLKFALEHEMSTRPLLKQQVYIRTTPDKLWDALTRGDITQQYYFNTRVKSTWEQGAPYQYVSADGGVMISGEVIESVPPTRLVTTFNALWMPEDQRGETTRVTFEIEPFGPACKLTVTHEGLTPETPLMLGVTNGWAEITSSLKSLLETGEPLNINTM